MTSAAHKAKQAITSGKLAEQIAFDLLSIKEPEYEIKAAHWQKCAVRVRRKQLEENAAEGKMYCIVFYSRPQERPTKGPRKGTRRAKYSIEEAFKRGPIIFAFVSARSLLGLEALGKYNGKADRRQSWLDFYRRELQRCVSKQYHCKKMADGSWNVKDCTPESDFRLLHSTTPF